MLASDEALLTAVPRKQVSSLMSLGPVLYGKDLEVWQQLEVRAPAGK